MREFSSKIVVLLSSYMINLSIIYICMCMYTNQSDQIIFSSALVHLQIHFQ